MSNIKRVWSYCFVNRRIIITFIVALIVLFAPVFGLVYPIAYDIRTFVFRVCPASDIENIEWTSITISYVVKDDIDGSTVFRRNRTTISDPVILQNLRGKFKIRSWDFLTLHYASEWNYLHIVLKNGYQEMIVLWHFDTEQICSACYYDWRSRAIEIVIDNEFEIALKAILQQKEETGHVLFCYPVTDKRDFGRSYRIENQEKDIEPTWNKWRYGD